MTEIKPDGKGKVEVLVDDEDPQNPEIAIIASGSAGIAAMVSIFTAASLAFVGRGDEAAAGCPAQFVRESDDLCRMVSSTGMGLLETMGAELEHVTIVPEEKPGN